MKVLFINHEKELNGASMAMIDLINKLNKKCHIYVLTVSKCGSVYNALSEIDNINILVYPYYCCRVFKKSKFKWIINLLKWHIYRKFLNMYTVNKVSKFAKENGINIIHSNTSVVNIGALVSAKTNIKHILHIREFGDLDFDLYPIFNEKRYWDIFKNYTDEFICISNAIKCHYRSFEENKKILIYDGVDEKNIILKNDNGGNIINFLIAGRICKTKGQYLVVEAVKYLLSLGIKNFRVFIAGREFDKLIIDDNISNYIYKVGQINDLPSFRKNIDVELVCSKSEAFGRIVVEAMLGGIPVIGSDSGGIPELIINNKSGLLFKQGDYIDLANKMNLLIENPKKIKSMSKFAVEYAKKSFLSQRCADEIYELYKSIL